MKSTKQYSGSQLFKFGETDLEVEGSRQTQGAPLKGELALVATHLVHSGKKEEQVSQSRIRKSWWGWGHLYLNPDLILLPCGEVSELQLPSVGPCLSHPPSVVSGLGLVSSENSKKKKKKKRNHNCCC